MGRAKNHRNKNAAGRVPGTQILKTMSQTANPNTEKRNQVINDFGQKIGGAHKDRAREAAARLAAVDVHGLIAKPLSQVAKLPDLRALYTSGALTEEAARRAWYLWRQIGPKPASSRPWRVRDWADNAALLIAAVADTLAYGVSEKSQTPDGLRVAQSLELFTEEMISANWPADEYKPGAYYVGRHWMGSGAYSIHCPKSSYSKPFATVAEAVAAIREKVEGAAAKGPKFSVYKTSAGAYFIAPDGKPGIKLFEYTTSAEAWAAYGDKEKLGARYNELRTFPSERRDWNRPRVGADHRHGQDLSPEAFAAVFPFRGVEFGNWVNQLERAACLNECADALHDLARVVGIIPEAVTLGGSLAWAFGSRGVGRAAAHYETARRVVNLTKRSGNGCVAHEWFHALDNYLMIEAGKPSLFMVSDGAAYGNSEKSQLQEAAAALKAALIGSEMKRRSDRIDMYKAKAYWGTVVEMAARAFEAYVYYSLEDAGLCNDYLVNFCSIEEYDRPDCYPYPTREEAAQLAPLFDAFLMAAFDEVERLSSYTPEAIAEELPDPPAAVVYDPAQPVERAEFHAVEEVPAVAASLPMDDTTDTPAAPEASTGERYRVEVDGRPYGVCEKSQLQEMKAEALRSGLADTYFRLKEKHPDALLLFRSGDFYNLYRDDATAAREVLGLEVKPSTECQVTATFPAVALDTYLPKLIRAGHRVAICDSPAVYAFPITDTPTDPTPDNGGTGAAYGDSQKSQICRVVLQIDGDEAEWTGATPAEAVEAMWRDDEDLVLDGYPFTIEGDPRRYAYSSTIFHYCFDHGRINFEEALTHCVAE